LLELVLVDAEEDELARGWGLGSCCVSRFFLTWRLSASERLRLPPSDLSFLRLLVDAVAERGQRCSRGASARASERGRTVSLRRTRRVGVEREVPLVLVEPAAVLDARLDPVGREDPDALRLGGGGGPSQLQVIERE